MPYKSIIHFHSNIIFRYHKILQSDIIFFKKKKQIKQKKDDFDFF